MTYRRAIGRPPIKVDDANRKPLEALGRKIAKQRAAEALLADEVDETIALYRKKGVPVLRIAEYTGLTPKTVRASLERVGLHTPKKKPAKAS